MTYEDLLAALQGFLGSDVIVTVSHVDHPDVITMTLVGRLTRGMAEEGTYSDRGQPAGETVTFKIGDHAELGCGGVFIVWRDHFDGGDEAIDADGRRTVIVFMGDVAIGVRSA